MVQITRVTLSRCKFSSDNDKEIKAVKEILSVFNEGCYYSDLYKKGEWDGYNRFYDSRDFFDFGLLDELIFGLEKYDIEFKFSDSYFRKKNRIAISDKQRVYQKRAIGNFFENDIGIIKATPRGGKTFMAAEIMRINDLRFPNQQHIFVVDSEDLFNQAIKDISEYLEISKEEIGIINAKKHDFKTFNVAMAQNLVSTFYGRAKNQEKIRSLNKVLSIACTLIVDEIHDNSSEKRIWAYKKCKKLKSLCGLSGTPFKQFSLLQNLTVKGFFGGVCDDVTKEELQEEGFLSFDKVFLVGIDHVKTKKKKCDGYQEFLNVYIHENEYRNGVLIEVLNFCQRNKYKTLVLFSSKKHGNIISKLTQFPFINGDHSVFEREKRKNKFLKGKGKILLASNIFKKGITLPQAEVLVIADGGLESANLKQKYSRVLGSTDDKRTAAIIDLMDTGVKHFSEHSLNRLEVYDEEMSGRVEVWNDFELFSLFESLDEWITLGRNE